MSFAGTGARHVPTAPAFLKSRVMAVNEAIDIRYGGSVGCGIDRPHQQARHIERFGSEVTLHAIVAPSELGRGIGALVEGVEDRPAVWIYGSQIDDRAVRHPADRNIIPEIDSARALGGRLLLL